MNVPCGAVPTLLIVDPIHPHATREFGKFFKVHHHLQPSAQDFAELIREADAVVVRSGVKLTRDVIAAGEKLKLIARAGVGIDNIDLEAARERQVCVFNVPFISSRGVAEHAFGLMFAITRKIALADRQLRRNEWRKEELYGSLLQGKTLGIIGLGKIGAHLAKLARSFDMEVVATVARNIVPRKERLKEEGIELVRLETILRDSDIVSLHVPLTGSTKSLIGSRELGLMKRTAYLINLSRGGVVNEKALYHALKTAQIKGAATDVFQTERARSPLFDLDNVVVTPHIGAMTEESQYEIAQALVKNVCDFFAGNDVENRVC